MLPNSRLLARAFHRTSPAVTHVTRAFASSYNEKKWEGTKPKDHATQTHDKDNAQVDASRAGESDRASGGPSSAATSEEDKHNENEKAKKDHPEAPGPVMGMNDERGGKGQQ